MNAISRSCFSVMIVAVFCSLSLGCATQESVQELDKRVTALEQKQKAKDAAIESRQTLLETCVNIDGDQVYWNYVKLNGKPVANKPGVYTAPQYVWNEAEKQKKEKVDECKLLYGPRE